MEDAIAPPNETCNPKRIVSPTVTPHPLVPPGSSGCGSSLLTKLLLPKRCLLSLLVIIIVSAVIVPCTSSFLAEVAKSSGKPQCPHNRVHICTCADGQIRMSYSSAISQYRPMNDLQHRDNLRPISNAVGGRRSPATSIK